MAFTAAPSLHQIANQAGVSGSNSSSVHRGTFAPAGAPNFVSTPFGQFNLANLNQTAGGGATSNQYTVPVTSDAEQNAKNLTNAQWNYFYNKIRPVEQRAVSRLTDAGFSNKVAADAKREASKVFAATDGLEERQLSRFGDTATLEDARAIDRRKDLTRAGSIARARNDAKDTARDFQITGLQAAGQIGRGIAGQSIRTAIDQASTQNAREQTADNIRRQGKSNAVGTALNIAGTVAGLFSI